jgi:hypothetical protein
MNLLVKHIATSILDGILKQLDLLTSQIQSGDTAGALSNVDAIRKVVVGIKEKFLS